VVLLLALIAGGLLREPAKDPAVRLGAFLALGGAAYAICSTPGFHARAGVWAAPVLGLAVGNNLVLWLFARSLFGDSFRPHRAYVLAWLLLAGLGVVNGLSLAPAGMRDGLALALIVQAMGFAALATVQTISSWAADLVEPRRRLRVILVGGSAAHVVLTASAGLAPRLDSAPLVRLADIGVEAAIVLVVAWSLLRISTSTFLLRGPAAPGPASADLDASDMVLLGRLEREMTVERAYREEGLTIGRLAARLDAPEYRLRRVINRRLGQRNFAAYLNGHRLDEVKAALADPEQAAVPILTIALDAGFGSLGPFNRAFKAAAGATPSEYRRAALGEDANALTLGSAA
jgi:AraC-like DNA-binding protein